MAMGQSSLRSLSSVFHFFSAIFLFTSVHSHSPLLGVHPSDEKYYGAEVIKCKDGSRSFTRDRLNDNFCDCLDGTDEPGTSACPAGKFYCRNAGSTPKFIFSSRVNDGICDCCDGSDEYEGQTCCLNACIMGGNLQYKPGNYLETTRNTVEIEGSNSANDHPDYMIQKLKAISVIVTSENF
ncbi:hypothetical protein CRG98_036873 [Punica granatum]|uniref:Glucosidase II beta subunit N-terminal domain-containing protein n=1 Tax=Punica granatum TaxID=22663 RepID=A0A2I0IFG5_PUNGR|nr:hypothetical protein CRG98_036873 [Punica granatum]